MQISTALRVLALALIASPGAPAEPGSATAIPDSCNQFYCLDNGFCKHDVCMGPGLPCNNCHTQLELRFCYPEGTTFYEQCISVLCDCPK